jgi:hypothetical protein
LTGNAESSDIDDKIAAPWFARLARLAVMNGDLQGPLANNSHRRVRREWRKKKEFRKEGITPKPFDVFPAFPRFLLSLRSPRSLR